MPRVITQDALRARLGRTLTVVPIQDQKAAPAAPQTIDTAPIAAEVKKVGDAMTMMREVIGVMLKEHSDTVAQLTEKPALGDIEFVVTERDGFGRIVKMVARHVG